MRIFFLTLFPKELKTFFVKGIFQKAVDNHLFDVDCIDIRQFSEARYKSVDDSIYGGGDGMLLKADVLSRAIKSIPNYEEYQLIYTCPKGSVLTQEKATQLSKKKGLVIVSGYYEGVDERIFEVFNFQKMSIGDVVLSSGDGASAIIAESVVRLLPGVIGKAGSVTNDSHVNGLLECPHYTTPQEIDGVIVPDVLISGHHKRINSWRRQQSLVLTLNNRPDMLTKAPLTTDDKTLLLDYLKET